MIHHEDGWYFAECPELEIMDQGRTQREAIENLQKMVMATLLEAVETRNLDAMLLELGFRKTAIHQGKQFKSTISSYEDMHPLKMQVPLPHEPEKATVSP